MALLEIDNLQTYLYSRRGVNRAVDGVSFTLNTGHEPASSASRAAASR